MAVEAAEMLTEWWCSRLGWLD